MGAFAEAVLDGIPTREKRALMDPGHAAMANTPPLPLKQTLGTLQAGVAPFFATRAGIAYGALPASDQGPLPEWLRPNAREQDRRFNNVMLRYRTVPAATRRQDTYRKDVR